MHYIKIILKILQKNSNDSLFPTPHPLLKSSLVSLLHIRRMDLYPCSRNSKYIADAALLVDESISFK